MIVILYHRKSSGEMEKVVFLILHNMVWAYYN